MKNKLECKLGLHFQLWHRVSSLARVSEFLAQKILIEAREYAIPNPCPLSNSICMYRMRIYVPCDLAAFSYFYISILLNLENALEYKITYIF